MFIKKGKKVLAFILCMVFVLLLTVSFVGEAEATTADAVVEFNWAYNGAESTSPISITLEAGKTEYSIDLPFSTPGWEDIPTTSPASITITCSAITSPSAFQITAMETEGAYPQREKDGISASFNSDSGSIRMYVQIDDTDYTFLLFEKKFNGFVIEPDTIVGDWKKEYVSFPVVADGDEGNIEGSSHYSPKLVQVLLGTTGVALSLPDSDNNRMESITEIYKYDDATEDTYTTCSSITSNSGIYTIPIDNSTSYESYYKCEATTSSGAIETYYFLVQTIGVSARSEYQSGEVIFDTYVTYTPHPNRVIVDPYLLVAYTWGSPDNTLYYKSYSLGSSTSGAIVTPVVTDGDEGETSQTIPNSISAFLIEGALDINAEEFGGVVFGKGAGWNELLPNFVW